MPQGNTIGLRLSFLAPLVALGVLLLAGCDDECEVAVNVPPGVHYIRGSFTVPDEFDLSEVTFEFVHPRHGSFTATAAAGVNNADFSVRFEKTAPTVVWVHLLEKPESPVGGLLNTGPDDIIMTMRFQDVPKAVCPLIRSSSASIRIAS